MAYSITLTWSPGALLIPGSAGNVTGQEIQKKTSGGSFVTIATVGATDTTYVDTNVVENIRYEYKIVTLCTTGGPSAGLTTVSGVPECPQLDPPVYNDTLNTLQVLLPALPSGTDTYYCQYTVTEHVQPGDQGTVVNSGTIATQGNRGPTSFVTNNIDPEKTYTYCINVCISATVSVQCCDDFAVPFCSSPTNLIAQANRNCDIKTWLIEDTGAHACYSWVDANGDNQLWCSDGTSYSSTTVCACEAPVTSSPNTNYLITQIASGCQP